MKTLFQNKLVTLLVVVSTFILAGVAIFTALRLYQLRYTSVSPNAPEESEATNSQSTPQQCQALTFSITTGSPTPTPKQIGQFIVPQCGSKVVITNTPPSIHEGTIVEFRSSLGTQKLTDVESTANKVSELVLPTSWVGQTVTVHVIPGPSGLHSITWSDVKIACPSGTPTTTMTTTPTKTGTPTPTLTISMTSTPTTSITNSVTGTTSPTPTNTGATSTNTPTNTGTNAPTSSAVAQASPTGAALPDAGIGVPTFFTLALGVLVLGLSLVLVL